jgi:4-amino-4-deoxy-L-arabinose transferase-like glycosyltransferase
MEELSEEINRKKKSIYLNHRFFFNILIFAIVIRLFTLFVVFINDSVLWVEASTLLFNGINPYETNVDFFLKYPPLFYYLISFFGLLSNFSYLGPKLMVFGFDILNILIIYKMGVKIRNKNFALISVVYYSFNPNIILQFYYDVNEFVTLFLTLLAIYLIVTEKYKLSSISLSLGIAFKIYPVFFLIPITIYMYRNLQKKRIFNLLIYYILILLTLLLISLPFLLISPNDFIQNLLIHTSRRNLGDSIIERIPELLVLYNSAFEVFGISFSYQFIIQICVLSSIFIFFLLAKKTFNLHDLFTVIVIISFVLPLVNYQIQLKYTNLIGFPFLIFIMYRKMRMIKEIKVYIFFLLNLFIIIAFFLIFIFLVPPIGNLITIEYTITKGMLIVVFWIIGYIIYIFINYKDKNYGDFKVYILIVLPFITYNLFDNVLGVIFSITIILFDIFYVFYKYWYKFREHEKLFIISKN